MLLRSRSNLDVNKAVAEINTSSQQMCSNTASLMTDTSSNNELFNSKVVLVEVGAGDHSLSENRMTNDNLPDSSHEQTDTVDDHNNLFIDQGVGTTSRFRFTDYCRKKCGLLKFLPLAVAFIMAPISLILGFTLPDKEGAIVLGTSNVTQLLTFNPSDIVRVAFNGTEPATLYRSKCTDVKTQRHSLNYARSLDVNGEQHRIDEFYFVKNSSVYYNFSVPEMQDLNGCVAKVHIFNDYTSFSKEQVSRAISSYCLLQTSPLYFTISAAKEDQYYFVALESFFTATIKYTVAGEVLKYNVTSLPKKRCTFSANTCSISLSDYPGGEDVCIIATLQETVKFFLLHYIAELSLRRRIQEIALWVILATYPTIIMIYCFVYFVPKFKVKYSSICSK